MIKIFTNIFIISIFLSGCLSNEEVKPSERGLGSLKINYYANKSVTSLEIPPDLTSPDMQNSFVLSEFVSSVKENYVDFSDSQEKVKVLANPTGINVKKYGQMRWLEIDKNPDDVWILAREFLKLQGFSLEKDNKKTGILETNFLENRPDIPDSSLGFIRGMLGRALDQQYTFASVDKYRVRIEPLDDGKRTSLYLSLTSLEEIVNPRIDDPKRYGETAWKYREKDLILETEMLYRLMVYLGGDDVETKILEAKDQKIISAKVQDSINGYAKLVFDLDILDAWEKISWSIDQNNIDIEDKDIKERTFYIVSTRTSDKGIMSRLFGDEPYKKTFQLLLKSIGPKTTEVYFNDVSEENETETKEYSYDLFNQLAASFK